MHLAGHHPADRRDRDPGRDPALQPGHPDHVELVEVGGEDRQELGPLQQRHPEPVLGQVEHPVVEGQPGQLAVQEPVRRQRLGDRRSIAGRLGGLGLQFLDRASRCPTASISSPDVLRIGALRVHHITARRGEAIGPVEPDGVGVVRLDVELAPRCCPAVAGAAARSAAAPCRAPTGRRRGRRRARRPRRADLGAAWSSGSRPSASSRVATKNPAGSNQGSAIRSRPGRRSVDPRPARDGRRRRRR